MATSVNGYTDVTPTDAEIAKFVKAKGRQPSVGMVRCNGCGKRIWNSGLGRGAHDRSNACKVRSAQNEAMRDRLRGTATPTPAPLDIPAAVREYIEAEWRGAALVMADRRDVILAHLLATDPSLNLTAATFRFHKLVAEMRDNDSIAPASSLEPETLAAFAKMRTDNAAVITAAIAANDGLPLNVLPAAQGLAALEAITAEPAKVERGTRIKVTKGRYVGEFFAVEQVRSDGSVAIKPGWRLLWIKPSAFDCPSA